MISDGSDKKKLEMPVFAVYNRKCQPMALLHTEAFRVSSNRAQSKAERKRILKNRQRRIAYRLRGRAWDAASWPMFSARHIHYELSEKDRGLSEGGIGAMHLLVRHVGLIERIDAKVKVFKRHLPYFESDHVLNIAYNILSGGTCLEDLELRRNDEVYLDSLGAQRIPDPTTEGDFCRRFTDADIEALMDAINETRVQVWKRQPAEFFDEAVVDFDGSLAPTEGECKEGIGLSYQGVWSYHPLIVSLANTQEPLFLVNRPGNRPSHEHAAMYGDAAITLCREAGFKKITFRGDTDFTQTKKLDEWDRQNVGFVFGIDAMPNLVEIAENLPQSAWKPLGRKAKYEVKTQPRRRPENVKERIVKEKGYENIKLNGEDVAEFAYRPVACATTYRVVVVRKDLTVERGGNWLFDDFKYFFYLTNDEVSGCDAIVYQANDRCHQENLIEQLKNGVHALRMPVNDLTSNWAYMVMAALAWSLKAWFALVALGGSGRGRWREKHEQEKSSVLRMEFKKFLNAFIRVPAQLIRGGRRLIFRLLSWNPWQEVFLRGVDALRIRLRC